MDGVENFKGIGIRSTQLEVPSIFSAVVVPMIPSGKVLCQNKLRSSTERTS